MGKDGKEVKEREKEVYREDFILKVQLTKELEDSRDAAIRSIMTAVDLSVIDDRQRRKVRKVVLDNINNFFRDVCGIIERVAN